MKVGDLVGVRLVNHEDGQVHLFDFNVVKLSN